ncbi:hypothetical protein PIROE2DRAFT_64775 [Piromyces sp. E2]|nr:hypothetical protein PIROE2DRAFT_64775 [Piromyces sp. E2]|eukprot:OUM57854.1 hypothetical protein PIROE2DRAFT_64775 [Piromyces sp. E2]
MVAKGNSRRFNDRYEQDKKDRTSKKPNNSEDNHSKTNNAVNIFSISVDDAKNYNEDINGNSYSFEYTYENKNKISSDEKSNNPKSELNSEDHLSIVGNIIDTIGLNINSIQKNYEITGENEDEDEHADEIENKNNDKNEYNTEEKQQPQQPQPQQ